VDDRRQPIPQLFRELARSLDPEGREQGASHKAQKKRKKSTVASDNMKLAPVHTEPTLFEISVSDDLGEQEQPVTQVAQNITEDPDETRAISWSPATVRTGESNDDDAPVMGRLLGRAFRQTGTQ
jgi:hypothetical protein